MEYYFLPLKIIGDHKSRGGSTVQFGNTPLDIAVEITEHIAAEVIENYSDSAHRDFINFKKAAKFTQGLTNATPALRDLNGQLKRLGRIKTLAREAYSLASPAEDFSKDQSEQVILEAIDRMGAVLPMQSTERKQNFSKIILGVPDESI